MALAFVVSIWVAAESFGAYKTVPCVLLETEVVVSERPQKWARIWRCVRPRRAVDHLRIICAAFLVHGEALLRFAHLRMSIRSREFSFE